jgi:hypothetical protein
MKTQIFSVKRYVLGGLTAAAMLVPIASFAGAAQASMGSHGVRGELPPREAQLLGIKPQTPAPGLYPVSQSVQTQPQHLTLAEQAISPSNPNRPMNGGGQH